MLVLCAYALCLCFVFMPCAHALCLCCVWHNLRSDLDPPPCLLGPFRLSSLHLDSRTPSTCACPMTCLAMALSSRFVHHFVHLVCPSALACVGRWVQPHEHSLQPSYHRLLCSTPASSDTPMTAWCLRTWTSTCTTAATWKVCAPPSPKQPHTHTHTHVCIHTLAYTHAHAHTHTHNHSLAPLQQALRRAMSVRLCGTGC